MRSRRLKFRAYATIVAIGPAVTFLVLRARATVCEKAEGRSDRVARSWFGFDVLSVLPWDLLAAVTSNARGSGQGSGDDGSCVDSDGSGFSLARFPRLLKVINSVQSKSKYRFH